MSLLLDTSRSTTAISFTTLIPQIFLRSRHPLTISSVSSPRLSVEEDIGLDIGHSNSSGAGEHMSTRATAFASSYGSAWGSARWVKEHEEVE